MIDLLLRAFPPAAPVARLGPVHLAERWFESTAARRVLPGLALHVDVGPDDRFGAALGFMLGMTATTGGYAVPEGGARSLAGALAGCLEAAGGRVRLGAH